MKGIKPKKGKKPPQGRICGDINYCMCCEDTAQKPLLLGRYGVLVG